VRLGQRLVDAWHIANAEGDRIGIVSSAMLCGVRCGGGLQIVGLILVNHSAGRAAWLWRGPSRANETVGGVVQTDRIRKAVGTEGIR
jgi:hypothetical protein